MTLTATLLHLLSDASRRLKSKFTFFSSMNRRIPHTFFQNSNRPFVFILPVDFGIALATHFSSSSKVLAGLNLFSAISAIWLVKQRVCFELTNDKTEKRCINVKIISHTSTSATESQSTPQSVDYDPQKEYLNRENSLK